MEDLKPARRIGVHEFIPASPSLVFLCSEGLQLRHHVLTVFGIDAERIGFLAEDDGADEVRVFGKGGAMLSTNQAPLFGLPFFLVKFDAEVGRTAICCSLILKSPVAGAVEWSK